MNMQEKRIKCLVNSDMCRPCCVDMYGDGRTATHPDDAGKFSSELIKNFDVAKQRFLAAIVLKRQPMS